MTRLRTRVKICGLTSLDDARLAVALGADAVGFVFWDKSPRAVAPADMADLTRHLPPFVTRVGVFVDASPVEVAEVVATVGLDVVQLHGREEPGAYRTVGARLLRATSLRSESEMAIAEALPAGVTPIVDAHDPEKRGGTGIQADWASAARLAPKRPIVLAGGLTPDNVGRAIAAVRPWAVDVSSGVESAPGRKSADRLRAFFAAVAASHTEGM